MIKVNEDSIEEKKIEFFKNIVLGVGIGSASFLGITYDQASATNNFNSLSSTNTYEQINNIVLDSFDSIYNKDNSKNNLIDIKNNMFSLSILIPTKKNIEHLLTENIDKNPEKPLVVVLDNYAHGKMVNDVIDQQDNDSEYDMVYLSKKLQSSTLMDKLIILTRFVKSTFGSGSIQIKDHKIMDRISELYQDKEVFINMSYGESATDHINFKDLNNGKNILITDGFLNYMKEKDAQNNSLLKSIQDSNINLFVSDGNSITFKKGDTTLELSDQINQKLFYLSNGDYEKMKKISVVTNEFITTSSNFSLKKMDRLREMLTSVNANVDNLNNSQLVQYVNNAAIDCISNYKSISMAELNNGVENKINLVEAISDRRLLKNFKLLEKYNSDYKIDPELSSYISQIDGTEISTNTNEMSRLSEKYSDKYPELFKISSYGSIFKLNNLNRVIESKGFSLENGKTFNGTSGSSPSIMTKKLNEFLDSKLTTNIEIEYKQEREI